MFYFKNFILTKVLQKYSLNRALPNMLFVNIVQYIRTFVRLFVFPLKGQSFCVKVYKTSYFEDPLMDFIHIWYDDRYRSKVFISTIHTLGVTLGSRSQNFHKKVKVFCVYVYRYQPRVLLSMIPTPGVTEVKVTNLEFSYKSKKFCV